MAFFAVAVFRLRIPVAVSSGCGFFLLRFLPVAFFSVAVSSCGVFLLLWFSCCVFRWRFLPVACFPIAFLLTVPVFLLRFPVAVLSCAPPPVVWGKRYAGVDPLAGGARFRALPCVGAWILWRFSGKRPR